MTLLFDDEGDDEGDDDVSYFMTLLFEQPSCATTATTSQDVPQLKIR